MNSVNRLRRAWRLYQTDNRGDTVLAVVLVAVVLFPFVQIWREIRSRGR